MSIQIYNVLTKKKELLEPIVCKEVGIYLCGVTVYGRCHVGHLRCNLSFDAVVRYLHYSGYKVKYVRNLTDIDDKIIKRAKEIEEGPDGEWRKDAAYENYCEENWRERLEEDQRIIEKSKADNRHLAEIVADYFIDVFRKEDFAPFNLIEPDSEPRVSEHIPKVVALIERIVERGFAYEADGDVYFDVPAYHVATGSYGKLSGRDYTQLLEGARIAPTEKKRSAPDFALWKKSKKGEPAWDSPWGKGRPGWHIECSAMSVDKLGQPFDIHAGGKDLIFPHHENEIAQSEAAAGIPLCNTWMHNGFVTVGGVKMSKSLGNFLTIKDALKIAPAEVWRLLVLSTHYANPIDLSMTSSCQDSGNETTRGTVNIAYDRLMYFYETLSKAEALISSDALGTSTDGAQDLIKIDLIGDFEEAMNDDFNTAKALASIGDAMRRLNELCDMKPKQVKKLKGGEGAWIAAAYSLSSNIKKVLDALSLCTKNPDEELIFLRNFAALKLGLSTEAIEAKLAERNEARAHKDWARSDAIRDELKKMNIEISDSPKGTTWRIAQ